METFITGLLIGGVIGFIIFAIANSSGTKGE